MMAEMRASARRSWENAARNNDFVVDRRVRKDAAHFFDSQPKWRLIEFDPSAPPGAPIESDARAYGFVWIDITHLLYRLTIRGVNVSVLAELRQDARDIAIWQMLKYLPNEANISVRKLLRDDIKCPKMDVLTFVLPTMLLDEFWHDIATDITNRGQLCQQTGSYREIAATQINNCGSRTRLADVPRDDRRHFFHIDIGGDSIRSGTREEAPSVTCSPFVIPIHFLECQPPSASFDRLWRYRRGQRSQKTGKRPPSTLHFTGCPRAEAS